MQNVVVPTQDATWLFNFGHYFGLGQCDDSSLANSRNNCLNALQLDLVDIVHYPLFEIFSLSLSLSLFRLYVSHLLSQLTIAAQYPSALRINGKLVVLYYSATGSGTTYPSPSEFQVSHLLYG